MSVELLISGLNENQECFIGLFEAEALAFARLSLLPRMVSSSTFYCFVLPRNTKGSGNVSSVENFYFRNGGVFGETVKNKDVQMCVISLSLKFGSNRIDIAGFTSLFRAVNNSK